MKEDAGISDIPMGNKSSASPPSHNDMNGNVISKIFPYRQLDAPGSAQISTSRPRSPILSKIFAEAESVTSSEDGKEKFCDESKFDRESCKSGVPKNVSKESAVKQSHFSADAIQTLSAMITITDCNADDHACVDNSSSDVELSTDLKSERPAFQSKSPSRSLESIADPEPMNESLSNLEPGTLGKEFLTDRTREEQSPEPALKSLEESGDTLVNEKKSKKKFSKTGRKTKSTSRLFTMTCIRARRQQWLYKKYLRSIETSGERPCASVRSLINNVPSERISGMISVNKSMDKRILSKVKDLSVGSSVHTAKMVGRRVSNKKIDDENVILSDTLERVNISNKDGSRNLKRGRKTKKSNLTNTTRLTRKSALDGRRSLRKITYSDVVETVKKRGPPRKSSVYPNLNAVNEITHLDVSKRGRLRISTVYRNLNATNEITHSDLPKRGPPRISSAHTNLNASNEITHLDVSKRGRPRKSSLCHHLNSINEENDEKINDVYGNQRKRLNVQVHYVSDDDVVIFPSKDQTIIAEKQPEISRNDLDKTRKTKRNNTIGDYILFPSNFEAVEDENRSKALKRASKRKVKQKICGHSSSEMAHDGLMTKSQNQSVGGRRRSFRLSNIDGHLHSDIGYDTSGECADSNTRGNRNRRKQSKRTTEASAPPDGNIADVKDEVSIDLMTKNAEVLRQDAGGPLCGDVVSTDTSVHVSNDQISLGRKRRNPLADSKFNCSAGQSNSSLFTKVESHESVVTENLPVRKPGRPRKYPKVEQPNVEGDKIAQDNGGGEAKNSSCKRRGRPRKYSSLINEKSTIEFASSCDVEIKNDNSLVSDNFHIDLKNENVHASKERNVKKKNNNNKSAAVDFSDNSDAGKSTKQVPLTENLTVQTPEQTGKKFSLSPVCISPVKYHFTEFSAVNFDHGTDDLQEFVNMTQNDYSVSNADEVAVEPVHSRLPNIESKSSFTGADKGMSDGSDANWIHSPKYRVEEATARIQRLREKLLSQKMELKSLKFC